jgi:hypothetical protein
MNQPADATLHSPKPKIRSEAIGASIQQHSEKDIGEGRKADENLVLTSFR